MAARTTRTCFLLCTVGPLYVLGYELHLPFGDDPYRVLPAQLEVLGGRQRRGEVEGHDLVGEVRVGGLGLGLGSGYGPGLGLGLGSAAR